MTAEQVHEIGLAFAKKAWPGHEVLVTTHTDVAHLHNHFVINSVHYENGRKLRQSPGTLTELRSLSDGICQQHGLSVLEPYKKDGANISSREYRAAAKGDSWKFKLMAEGDGTAGRIYESAEKLQRQPHGFYTGDATARLQSHMDGRAKIYHLHLSERNEVQGYTPARRKIFERGIGI